MRGFANFTCILPIQYVPCVLNNLAGFQWCGVLRFSPSGRRAGRDADGLLRCAPESQFDVTKAFDAIQMSQRAPAINNHPRCGLTIAKPMRGLELTEPLRRSIQDTPRGLRNALLCSSGP